MKNWKFTILLIGVLLFIAVPFTFWRDTKNSADIKQWVADRGNTATEIEWRGWNTGPYWPDKNVTIYHVDTQKGNIYWFKYSVFGRTIYTEDDHGKYEKVED